jgi:anti-sigma B factor antagonist
MDEVSEQLVVDVIADGERATVRVTGELDVHTAHALSEAITKAFDAGATSIEVDAGSLRFCDSSGIQVLVQAREQAMARGGVVTVIGVRGPVEKVLTVTGLLELFTA